MRPVCLTDDSIIHFVHMLHTNGISINMIRALSRVRVIFRLRRGLLRIYGIFGKEILKETEENTRDDVQKKVWKRLFKHHFIRERESRVGMRPVRTKGSSAVSSETIRTANTSQHYILIDFAAGKYPPPVQIIQIRSSGGAGLASELSLLTDSILGLRGFMGAWERMGMVQLAGLFT